MLEPFIGLDLRTIEVLNKIYKRGPITKKKIQSIMDLKLTTLNRMMIVLEERRLIFPLGKVESTGGRKATTYDVVHQGFYLIGVDLSMTHIKIVLTNLRLTILRTNEFNLDEQCAPEKAIAAIISMIEQMIKEESIKKNQILGIGMGIVGSLDREHGIVSGPEGYSGEKWSNIPLKSIMEEGLSIPCFIDNGANNAVLAEYRFGTAKNLQSVAYIYCGIEIRSAVIKDGILIRAMNDQENAFGNMIVQLNESGIKNCISNFSTQRGLIRLITAEHKFGCRELNEVDYKGVVGTKQSRDEEVQRIIRNSATIFGIGLSNFVRLLNPDMVILSGPLFMGLEDYYQECIRAFYDNYHFADKPIFNKGGLFQKDAIAIGSAAMVMEKYLQVSTSYREINIA